MAKQFCQCHIQQKKSRMASVKAALDNLQLAFTQYKQSKSVMVKDLNTLPKNERNIKNKMVSHSTSLAEIDKCHTLWVTKAGLSDEELNSSDQKYNKSWLEALWDESDDLQQKAGFVVASLNPVASENNKIHLLKLDIILRVDSFLKATSPAEKILNTASLKAYEDIFKEVQSSFSKDLNIVFNDLKDQDQGNVKSHCTTFEKFKMDIQPKLFSCSLQTN